MGIVSDEVYTINTNVVTETISQNTSIVTEEIPQHKQTIVCTEGSGSSLWNETGSMDMSIYRIFSMQDDMKVLTEPVRTRNEFDLFLQYAEAKTLGAVDTKYDSLDEYLGTIGVTNEMCEV